MRKANLVASGLAQYFVFDNVLIPTRAAYEYQQTIRLE
ncbi:hypothetical protein J2S36_000350 [Arcanobacterium hippocoleae]|uniref:Uncharacterized protein n=1 Tax=Arcanobacterium hippocoleae TaxID=149017 RepID=A0ABU1T090_9ACTO|nr:hypothetical protein [Arcanobacterium hippocoleae]